jgi:PTH1 family peptidyl-tRNA hydrolase
MTATRRGTPAARRRIPEPPHEAHRRLGNPGPKQRPQPPQHRLARARRDLRRHGFALWRSKFQGQISEGRLGADKALLLKPETFMNLSGDSVRAAMAFHKLDPRGRDRLHDELDLPPGRVRVKTGGGHAGHNGLRSIAAHVGPDFARVRLGIGHPGDKRVVSNYVLSDFAKAEADWLDPLLDAVARAAPTSRRAIWTASPPPSAKPSPRP